MQILQGQTIESLKHAYTAETEIVIRNEKCRLDKGSSQWERNGQGRQDIAVCTDRQG